MWRRTKRRNEYVAPPNYIKTDKISYTIYMSKDLESGCEYN